MKELDSAAHVVLHNVQHLGLHMTCLIVVIYIMFVSGNGKGEEEIFLSIEKSLPEILPMLLLWE